MNPYKILFPVETASRELFYKLFLACKFASYGHECFVGSKQEINALFSRVSPFVYFDKGYHPKVSEKIYDRIRKYGGLIVSLDEEGGVDFKHAKTITARYPEKIFDLCDLVFLWGIAQYNLLKKHRKNFNESKIVVSGHPRFELLKTEYQKIYQQDVARLEKRFGKYILINTNMGFGNNIRGTSFVHENYGSRIPNLDEIIAFDKQKQLQIVELVTKLSTRLSNNIVIRPHPEEDLGFYKEAFRGVSNVSIVYEGSVVPWLIGAEVMIHPDCTTGIESLMIGKRSISVLPIVNDVLNTFAAVQVSTSFQDTGEVVDYIGHKKYLLDHSDSEDHILHDFFSFSSKSSEIIVSNVLKIMKDRVDVVKNINVYSYSFERTVRSYFARVKNIVLNNKVQMLSEQKIAGLDSNNVISFLQHISRTFFSEENLSIKPICSRLYRILG